MASKLRIAYFAHSLRSDWNNGNAHFLRGLMRSLGALGHDIRIFEASNPWSLENLRHEAAGEHSLSEFVASYPELKIITYDAADDPDSFDAHLSGTDVAILHEWNPPELAHVLLQLRSKVGFKLLFHDTHHRASSSPQEIERFGLRQFDGVLAFGGALRDIYVQKFGIGKTWVLHEAADHTVFRPHPEVSRNNAIVWVGNWGEGERSREIQQFLLNPASALRNSISTTIYGVRYPEDGLAALRKAGAEYGGYLPNLDAPLVYARARATVHVPRQQYSAAMCGIPTIRVFEALACGIPLVSAPWQDSEGLFRNGDFLWAKNSADMTKALELLVTNSDAAAEQTGRGLETVLARHTCQHRAEELTAICEDVLR